MALRKFTPDPDLFDPEDPEAWYGTWEHDDGSSLYGQGDPDIGQQLMAQQQAQPDQRLAQNAPEPSDFRMDAPPTGLAPPPSIARPPEQSFETALSPSEEQQFQSWKKQYAPQDSGADYDLRGAFKAGVAPDAASGHWPDTFKKPNHPTFSVESQYASAAPDKAGSWNGDQYVPAGAGGADWADDVPPQVSTALAQHATEAGLDPARLAAVIKHESGWDPSKGSNGDAGQDVHAGLIQFSRKLWPGVAEAAGRPDVSFEEMRAMSAEEQVPFVVAYYKGKGLTPESSEGDYRLATYKPAHLGEGDDFVLDDAASDKGIPVKPENARLDKNGDGIINSYEQNAGLDKNGDGKITAGEVRGGPGGAAGAAPALRGMGGAPGMQIPGQAGGLPLAEVQMQGPPLSPADIAAKQQNVQGRYAALAQAQQEAQNQRLAGREEVMQQWTQAYQQQETDATAEQAKQQQIAQEATAKIDREVNQPIQRVNPTRYLSNLSTGGAILGAIGVALAGLGQAYGMTLGMNPGSNSGMDALNKAIDQDIQLQKDEIAQGREQSQSRIAHWTRTLGNAEQGERAARAEAKQAAGGLLQAKAMASDNAEIRAKGMEQAATLFAQGQQELQGIADIEKQKLTARYATPPPRAAGANPAENALKTIEAAKAVKQELELSGKSPEEVDATMRAMGLPVIAGPSRQQAQHTADTKHKDETLDDKERVAESAFTTLNEFGKTTPLKRNVETGKWEVPKEAGSGFGWKLSNRAARNAYQGAAVESFGRLQSQGVISPSEEVRFKDMIGGNEQTLEEMAQSLNAVELIIQSRRNQTRQGSAAVPGAWQ